MAITDVWAVFTDWTTTGQIKDRSRAMHAQIRQMQRKKKVFKAQGVYRTQCSPVQPMAGEQGMQLDWTKPGVKPSADR